MIDSLTPDLRRRLETLSRNDAGKRLSFIVKLGPGAEPESIARMGMAIAHHIPTPPLLIGTMTASQALAVAALDDVARVEYDSHGVRGLSEPD